MYFFNISNKKKGDTKKGQQQPIWVSNKKAKKRIKSTLKSPSHFRHDKWNLPIEIESIARIYKSDYKYITYNYDVKYLLWYVWSSSNHGS